MIIFCHSHFPPQLHSPWRRLCPFHPSRHSNASLWSSGEEGGTRIAFLQNSNVMSHRCHICATTLGFLTDTLSSPAIDSESVSGAAKAASLGTRLRMGQEPQDGLSPVAPTSVLAKIGLLRVGFVEYTPHTLCEPFTWIHCIQSGHGTLQQLKGMFESHM